MSIVTVTAYHPGVTAPGSPKGITASGQRVSEGMLAVSRDVEKALNLDFGDRVMLHGLGVFDFQDRMHARCHKESGYLHGKLPEGPAIRGAALCGVGENGLTPYLTRSI